MYDFPTVTRILLVIVFAIGCRDCRPNLVAAEPLTHSPGSPPQALTVQPESVTLAYQSDSQRIIVQAMMTDGSTRDVTESAEVHFDDPAIAELVNGQVRAKKSGTTSATVTWQGQTVDLAIDISDNLRDRPLRFRNDILPVLTRVGCNAGKCHGAASGKDGFRLSLYGFDPEGDYYRITEEMSGRRINLARPDECLLVNKATGRVPHTGGMKIEPGTVEYRRLVTWIAGGALPDPASTPLPTKIEVYPKRAVMSNPGQAQSMSVVAQYDDGSVRDVTDMAVFLSNNDSVATVSDDGSVLGTGPGAAFMLARFDEFTDGTSIIVRSGKNYPEFDFQPANYIDELTLARWRDLHILPSELASDEVFLRRVYLDMTGLLPTIDARQSFLADSSQNKRAQLIDDLSDGRGFQDMWILKLAELLQIRSTNGLSSKGLQLYDDWLRDRVHAGVTVDKIISELLPASGSTFENPPTSYYQTETTPQLLAENIAQAFLGTRIQCAQCHNHPFDRWTMDDYYGFASFVSQVGYKQAKDPREITVYNLGEGNLQHPVAGRSVVPKFLGGLPPELSPGEDYRSALAIWLTSPDNKAFANNIANIVWANFMGVGIVDAVDDVRVSNPPSNPELLDALGAKLVEYGFDVRKLSQDICKSNTYQLSTRKTEWNEWDSRHFSHATIRRVRAEVLLDCITQVTQTSNRLSGLPLGGRAIEVPDGASNNYFLETFGRASRSTACSCEVSTAPTLSQALHLLNGENTTGKIVEGGWVDQMLSEKKSSAEIVDAIYTAALCRSPTAKERTSIDIRLSGLVDLSTELNDLFWAVLNSNEFIFNH
jgi:hypothetical protein